MPPRRREQGRGDVSPPKQERRGIHPLRQLFGRTKALAKGVAVLLLFLIGSVTVFFVITGAIGFGPGDDGYTVWFALLLLLNVVFGWAYGKHLRWQSPHWPT